MVTVQSSFSRSWAAGLPTMLDRPTTTAFRPASEPSSRFRRMDATEGRAGHQRIEPHREATRIHHMEAIDVLGRSIAESTFMLSICAGSGNWTRMPWTQGLRSASGRGSARPAQASRRGACARRMPCRLAVCAPLLSGHRPGSPVLAHQNHRKTRVRPRADRLSTSGRSQAATRPPRLSSMIRVSLTQRLRASGRSMMIFLIGKIIYSTGEGHPSPIPPSPAPCSRHIGLPRSPHARRASGLVVVQQFAQESSMPPSISPQADEMVEIGPRIIAQRGQSLSSSSGRGSF